MSTLNIVVYSDVIRMAGINWKRIRQKSIYVFQLFDILEGINVLKDFVKVNNLRDWPLINIRMICTFSRRF